ncbi:MAG: hypothetical protein ACJ72Z_13460 [Pyrinomonadaceae bacterium]
MNESVSKYDITPRELKRGRNLKIAAWTTTPILTGIPAIITLFSVLFLAGSPPVAATFLFLGLVVTLVAFLASLALTGFFGYRYSRWKEETRERMAADGIKAEEIEWFTRELRPAEKRALRSISAQDELLADAYRETLASRLTATRIVKSSRKELNAMQKRQTRLGSLNSQRRPEFQEQIRTDIQKISGINNDAKEMLVEAEARLQMIEAAAMRGGGLADSELALKKLSARTSELPIALEAARLHQETVEELQSEMQSPEINLKETSQ